MRVSFVILAVLAWMALPVRADEVTDATGEEPQGEAPKRFIFANVHRRAAVLAEEAFDPDQGQLPEILRDLPGEQFKRIRFRPQKALWRGNELPFEVQLIHRGHLSRERVNANVVDQGEVIPVTYAGDQFDYGKAPLPAELPSDVGFAGFKLFYPINTDERYDEVVVFLGASYFRAVGQGQRYGLSMRGLAIDTGLPKKEEFPFFREFWIVKPDRDATQITIYALMDSKSATGAYRFVIKPGRQTVIDVKASVFMRNEVEKLGVAPLTSMFLHGEQTIRKVDDFRPEVHDSDGLLLNTENGEWIWRPLDNPPALRISSFQDTNPRGFGLLQRDRVFTHYQEIDTFYQIRPSAWVEPVGEWGKGVFQLIEIPSDADKYDNIVAFWVPEKKIKAGDEFKVEYRLHHGLHFRNRPPGGRTLSTRVGRGGPEGRDPNRRRFVLDFGGQKLKELGTDADVKAVISASSGKVVNIRVRRNEFTRGWRVYFDLVPEGGDPVELRCFLKLAEHVLTETWSYQWNGTS